MALRTRHSTAGLVLADTCGRWTVTRRDLFEQADRQRRKEKSTSPDGNFSDSRRARFSASKNEGVEVASNPRDPRLPMAMRDFTGQERTFARDMRVISSSTSCNSTRPYARDAPLLSSLSARGNSPHPINISESSSLSRSAVLEIPEHG